MTSGTLFRKRSIASLFRIVKRHYSHEWNLKNHSLPIYFHDCRDFLFGAFHVRVGRFGQSFTSSQITVFPYYLDEIGEILNPYKCKFEKIEKSKGYYVKIKPLFSEGIEKVQSIVRENESVQHDTWHSNPLHKAVQTLHEFQRNIAFHEECLVDLAEKNKDFSELETKVLLANHLFLPLVSCDNEESCILSDDSKLKIVKCPCSKSCSTDIIYGDCSFGSSFLWFGKSDIMLFPVGGGSVNILVKHKASKKNTVEEVQAPEIYRQMKGHKSEERRLRSDKSILQIVSQAITFSMYQKKYQQELNKNSLTTLIPTIVVSSHYFDVYLYDAQNDILLRNLGSPIPIFKQKLTNSEDVHFEAKFYENSILLLWMLINHMQLKPAFSVKQLNILKESCGVKKELVNSNLMVKVDGTLRSECQFVPQKMSVGTLKEVIY